jgi:hypothetical protein
MILLTFLTTLLFSDVYIKDGYTDKLSAYPGETVQLFLNASADTTMDVELYDLAGNVVHTFRINVFQQETPKGKAYENGFDYKSTATIVVPNLPSGVYQFENSVPFIVKNKNPKIVILYSANTENAYASSGGKSLYTYNSDDGKKADRVSFARPIPITKHGEAFMRWMLQQPFKDVGYITDLDMENYSEIRKASILIVTGHSEYWTLKGRKNFDRFVADGKNALVLSGNTMWWQVRYEGNQMVCYKSDDDKVKKKNLRTTRWNDPTLGYPILKSIGVDFSLAGYGLKKDKGWDGFHVVSNSPLLENTGLVKGDIIHCSTDEYDGAPVAGYAADSIPVINKQALGFDKVQLIGYDRTSYGGADGIATWIIFKANRSSGIVINTASTDWCSSSGIGQSELIQTITFNMIDKLLRKQNVFSVEEEMVLPVVSN